MKNINKKLSIAVAAMSGAVVATTPLVQQLDQKSEVINKIDANVQEYNSTVNTTTNQVVENQQHVVNTENEQTSLTQNELSTAEVSTEDTRQLAEANTSGDVYIYKIYAPAIGIIDDSTLDLTLKRIFNTNKDIAKLLKNGSSYKNVDLKYVDKSANYANSYFKITATPKDGFKFSNGDASKEITITLPLIKNEAKSSVPLKDDFKPLMNVNDKSNAYDINKYLNENFANASNETKISMLSQANIYSNVDIAYVNDSVNVKTKTFKIIVTPKTGSAWVNGDTDAKIIEVGYNATDIITVNLPNMWSLNAVATYGEMMFKWGKVRDVAKNFEFIANLAGKDVESRIKGVKYLGYLGNQEKRVDEIYLGAMSWCWIKVGIDLDTHRWSDGYLKAERLMKVNFFSSEITKNATLDVQVGVDNTEAEVMEKNKYGMMGLPYYNWVSNFVYEYKHGTSDGEIYKRKDAILKDLQMSFPDWSISITRFASLGSKDQGTWMYNLKFIYKADPSIAKEMHGISFSRFV